MRNYLLLLLCWMISYTVTGQSILMEKGFEDLKIGITETQADEYIGFSGTRITLEAYRENEEKIRATDQLPEIKKGFDVCLVYKHIMPIPVTRVFLKKGLVSMVEISSYPDFTRPICLDSKTTEGLTFYASKEQMEKIYGKSYRQMNSRDGNIQYYYYDQTGIGFAITNNEIRIIYYY